MCSSVTRLVFVGYEASLCVARRIIGFVSPWLRQCHTRRHHGSVDALMDRLRSVLNGSARLIYASRRTEHVTPLLRDLHWLRYPDGTDPSLVQHRGQASEWPSTELIPSETTNSRFEKKFNYSFRKALEFLNGGNDQNLLGVPDRNQIVRGFKKNGFTA